MSGILYVGRTSGLVNSPLKDEKLLSNNIAAASATSPALWNGDLVVLSTNATLNTSGVTGPQVLRRLAIADRTALFQQGGVNAGIYGLIMDNILTDAQGKVSGSPITNAGGVIFQVPNEAGAIAPDYATKRGRANIYIADSTMIFSARINVNTTDFAAGLLLGRQNDNVLAGLQITADGNNDAIYTLDMNAAATKVLEILRPDEADARYNTTILGTDTRANNALADARSGPRVFFRFLDTYCQARTGIPYTTTSGAAT